MGGSLERLGQAAGVAAKSAGDIGATRRLDAVEVLIAERRTHGRRTTLLPVIPESARVETVPGRGRPFRLGPG